MILGEVVSKLLLDARSCDIYTAKANKKRYYGLTLTQYEEFILYVMLVITGIKSAYLVDSMVFSWPISRKRGGKKEKCTDESSKDEGSECIEILICSILSALTDYNLPSCKGFLVVLSIPNISESEKFRNSGFTEDVQYDYIIVSKTLLQLKIETMRAFMKRLAVKDDVDCSAFDMVAPSLFFDDHVYLVDVNNVSGGSTDTNTLLFPFNDQGTKVEEIMTSIMISLEGLFSLEVQSQLECIVYELRNVSQLQCNAGMSFFAGWLLSYPCIYRSIQTSNADDESVVDIYSNLLSNTPLRKTTIAIAIQSILMYEFVPTCKSESESSVTADAGVSRYQESLNYCNCRDEINIMDFTVPECILEASGSTTYDECIERTRERMCFLINAGEDKSRFLCINVSHQSCCESSITL